MEDKLLIWKLNCGSRKALCRIYEKYRDDLLRIAAGLLNDIGTAEDVVQEVFVMLVHSMGNYKVKTNLRGYLTTCVVNKVRDLSRTKKSQNSVSLDDIGPAISNSLTPHQSIVCEEEYKLLYEAIARLPYEQKETLVLHIQGKIKFKDIARIQETPVSTTLSRYRYGINKLRSMLNSEVEK